jgi:hypothetical protein
VTESGSQLELTTELILRDFHWERSFFGHPQTADDLEVLLERALKPLLDRDLARLLQILYRLDVAEEKVKRLLAEAPPELMARELARLIIAREWQKVHTRIHYSSTKDKPN